MKKQVKMHWSKRENDWEFIYPDLDGKSLMGPFFDMTKTTGHKIDWEVEFKKMLTDRGYDYKTFKITCDKLEGN